MKNQPVTTKKSASGATPPDFAPGHLAKETALEHFERGARPTLERNRWFLIALVLAAGHVANGIGWNIALPLKTVQTFQVNKVDGGRLVADGTAVGNWAPDSDSIAYFINKWANSVFDVNRATIDGTLTESGELVIGTAKAQLQEMRRKDNPLISMRDYPQYSRTYEFTTINFIKDDVALVRFRTITRLTPESTPMVVTYAMTVSFTRVKPTTRAEVMKNPAGLFITNINLTEESVTK
ncbi:type IV secretion system protein [Massilia aerilata]|uniref:Type IV secretion system protein n=1 Tax=Massilia aerilata TaxID=453817 RepID=A0ABW0S076_9BURK